ncbi:MAG: patatin-like phospholipase family protein [Thiotrichales bacterium]|nr:patatin-like phospholipase family protein [Thiotrichales bacterium]
MQGVLRKRVAWRWGLIALTVGLTACSSQPPRLDYVPALQTLAELQQSPVDKRLSGRPLALAFGGGGVRGYVHLGVIKALDEAGVRADLVTGTSVGAMAAALYAAGLSYAQIESLINALDRGDLVDFSPQKFGFLEHQALADWVEQATGFQRIEALPIPLGITVTDLQRREPLLITSGPLGETVKMSSSVPGSFIPTLTTNSILVDGGVLNNLPVRFAKAMGAERVIAIDIYCGAQNYPATNAFGVLFASTRLQSCALTQSDQQAADILIQPNFEPENPRSLENRQAAIEAGYQATRQRLPEILQYVQGLNEPSRSTPVQSKP